MKMHEQVKQNSFGAYGAYELDLQTIILYLISRYRGNYLTIMIFTYSTIQHPLVQYCPPYLVSANREGLETFHL